MTENKDKRKGWLRELKVGDIVFVVNNRKYEKRLDKISKITPTGIIIVGTLRFDHNGHLPYGDNWYCGNTFLKQATQETIKEYELNQAKKRAVKKALEVLNNPNVYEKDNSFFIELTLLFDKD